MTSDPKRRSDAQVMDEEGFVARWSRRKRAARVAPVAVTVAPPPVTPDPAPVLTDADMPPIESLTADSDFTPFLSPGVSESLRRLALRKLFAAPAFNTRCPLDSEYYDCANMTPLGSIITHEMREALEREAQERLRATLSETADGDGPAAAAGADTEPPARGGAPA